MLEDYPINRLVVVDVAGRLELHGWYDGVECLLDGKPSWLAAGIVACVPLDPVLGLDWPMQTEAYVGGVLQRVDSTTADPDVVNAVRMFQRAVADGTAHLGMSIAI